MCNAGTSPGSGWTLPQVASSQDMVTEKAETVFVGPLTALHAMQAAALAAAGPFHSWHTVKRRQ